MIKISKKAKVRYLRKTETPAEKILWQKLRDSKLGIKFRRQYPVSTYILDFYAPKIKLAIELDGSIHKENKGYNEERTKYLNSKNIKVVRFWNSEIENDLENILNKIRTHLTP